MMGKIKKRKRNEASNKLFVYRSNIFNYLLLYYITN